MLDRNKTLTRDVTEHAQYFEYTKAADPIGSGTISQVPYHSFSPALYAEGESRVVPLDLSAKLGCEWAATGPGLLANFVRLNQGDSLKLKPLATSQIFYTIKGKGQVSQSPDSFEFEKGAFFALPGGVEAELIADEDAAFYYITDEPLLHYLGVTQTSPRFKPTLYPAADALAALEKAASEKDAASRSRVSVLLGNANFPKTQTVTHVLWAMFGLLPAGAVQKPHRHQSIALDFIVDAPKGCYTLVGRSLNEKGEIQDPVRVDWESGMAFITPPGFWHAHFNESDKPARLIPIQDAGLQTWLRALDIRFSRI